MEKVEELGGSVHAIEAGFIQREIEESAFAYHRAAPDQAGRPRRRERVRRGGRRGRRRDPEDRPPDRARPGRAAASASRKTATRKRSRGGSRTCARLPRASGNLLYPIKDALRDHATLGEVCGVMREEFGEYKPPSERRRVARAAAHRSAACNREEFGARRQTPAPWQPVELERTLVKSPPELWDELASAAGPQPLAGRGRRSRETEAPTGSRGTPRGERRGDRARALRLGHQGPRPGEDERPAGLGQASQGPRPRALPQGAARRPRLEQPEEGLAAGFAPACTATGPCAGRSSRPGS